MKILVLNDQSTLPLTVRTVKALVRAVVVLEGERVDEVSISFLDAAGIGQVHAAYFNDPSPTDCISIPLDADRRHGHRVLGDVIVCPAVAVAYAAKRNKCPRMEVSLYLVHGLLHLFGYDDIEPIARRKMRAAERRHMRHLQEQGLLL